jgi:hypothetical protein
MRQKAGEVVLLTLDLLILSWASGVFSQEVEVTHGNTCSRHDLLELLLLLLVSEAVLLLIVALVAGVIPVGAVILLGGVEFLPLGIVSDEVGGVATLEAAPGWPPPLLAEFVQSAELLANKVISLSEMLSYYSSEATAKEDRANFKADETVLVGLESWPPTWALVIKALLVREASWLGRPFLDNSWDL